MKKLNSNQKGLTLIELLVAISILAILVTLAAPSLQDTRKSSEVRGHVRDFKGALMFARGEAVTRNKIISMCPSADGAACDTANDDWTNGWLIFVDNGSAGFANGIFNSADGEELLRVYEYDGTNSVAVLDPGDDGTTDASVDFLTWNHRGFMFNDARSLVVVCEQDKEERYTRGLMIERSGRVFESYDADADNVHDRAFEDENGNRYTEKLGCP